MRRGLPLLALRGLSHRHDIGRERGIAQIDGPSSIAETDARDPKATSVLRQVDCRRFA
jgi:hypothetical protein